MNNLLNAKQQCKKIAINIKKLRKESLEIYVTLPFLKEEVNRVEKIRYKVDMDYYETCCDSENIPDEIEVLKIQRLRGRVGGDAIQVKKALKKAENIKADLDRKIGIENLEYFEALKLWDELDTEDLKIK